ncbi:MAG: CPBP family intramembrane glutamic endopeptidase [Methanosarcina sp.]
MKNLINFHKRRKEPNLLISVSVLILTLLVIFPGVASSSNLESSSPQIGHVQEQISTKALEESGDPGVTSVSYGNLGLFQKIGQYIDIVYALEGIVVAILILILYRRMNIEELKKFTKNPLKGLYSHPTWEISKTEETDQEKSEIRRIRLFTAVPILFIAFAELLLFSGRNGAAVWIHIITLIALSLSNLYIKDPKIHNIYQSLMLLPVLRLVNLSMPVFYDKTLYTFIFVYGPLAIPVAVIIMNQRKVLEQIGISRKNIGVYMILSIPLGFLVGLGEYLTIRPQSLIPDLTFENLLILTIIMIFFVGLIEELIFRSIIQTRLEQAFSAIESILITSFLFGLMHSGYGTFYEILYTGFVGLFMGFAFYKTRSLPFVAVLHGFVNVFLFGILPYYLSGWAGF